MVHGPVGCAGEAQKMKCKYCNSKTVKMINKVITIKLDNNPPYITTEFWACGNCGKVSVWQSPLNNDGLRLGKSVLERRKK